MTVSANDLTRTEKRDTARKLHENLVNRALAGPAEPALDEYIPELDGLVQALSAPITGDIISDAQRTARLATLNSVDCDVDTSYRHVEGYLAIEGRRRVGPNVASAQALHKAAFPQGLAHVDATIPAENRACRESLTVLRAKDYAPTVLAIGLPLGWLDAWEASLTASDSLYHEIEQARAARKTHVSAGQDAESDFVELVVRLRRYIGSRAKASDKARVAEGKVLLAPLLDAIARMRATAAARATARENGKEATPNEAAKVTSDQA